VVDLQREKAAWRERGSRQWDPMTHGRGLSSLIIQAKTEMVERTPGMALPKYDTLEFRLEGTTVNGQSVDAIVCEGVVVESWPPSRLD
jgi:hypothetical protein